MNYTITPARGAKHFTTGTSVREFTDVSEIWNLVREDDNAKNNERIKEVLGWLIAHPMVLFVGDTDIYDKLTHSLNGTGCNSYAVEADFPKEEVMRDVTRFCTRGATGDNYFFIRRIVWSRSRDSVFTRHSYLPFTKYDVPAMIRKHMIDEFLLAN